MKIAFQIDPLDSLNYESDSSLRLMLEAQKRDFEVFIYNPKDLYAINGIIKANLKKAHFHNNIISLENLLVIDCVTELAEMDYLLIRQDPPFDMSYFTNCILLEKLGGKTKIINNPKAIRDFPEKIFPLKYPDLIAPTLITQDLNHAIDFFMQHNKVIIKPLYNGGGNDIFLAEDLESLKEHFNKLLAQENVSIIIQRYIAEISQGDKRIILIDGEPVGAILRVPAKNSIKANMVAGGTAVACEITERDLEICAALKDALKENGLFFVGIDVIGDYLTEINTTSPTGIAKIKSLYDIDVAEIFFDKLCKI